MLLCDELDLGLRRVLVKFMARMGFVGRYFGLITVGEFLAVAASVYRTP